MTQAVNKVDPFLSAHAAHLFSYAENWKKNPQGMATGLAIPWG